METNSDEWVIITELLETKIYLHHLKMEQGFKKSESRLVSPSEDDLEAIRSLSDSNISKGLIISSLGLGLRMQCNHWDDA